MNKSDIKEYLIDGKLCVDVLGVATMLGKAVGTIRNMTNIKNFPPHVKIGNKLYFEKHIVKQYQSGKKVIEVGTST